MFGGRLVAVAGRSIGYSRKQDQVEMVNTHFASTVCECKCVFIYGCIIYTIYYEGREVNYMWDSDGARRIR